MSRMWVKNVLFVLVTATVLYACGIQEATRAEIAEQEEDIPDPPFTFVQSVKLDIRQSYNQFENEELPIQEDITELLGAYDIAISEEQGNYDALVIVHIFGKSESTQYESNGKSVGSLYTGASISAHCNIKLNTGQHIWSDYPSARKPFPPRWVHLVRKPDWGTVKNFYNSQGNTLYINIIVALKGADAIYELLQLADYQNSFVGDYIARNVPSSDVLGPICRLLLEDKSVAINALCMSIIQQYPRFFSYKKGSLTESVPYLIGYLDDGRLDSSGIALNRRAWHILREITGKSYDLEKQIWADWWENELAK